MNARDVASLAFRVGGLYALVSGIDQLPALGMAIRTWTDPASGWTGTDLAVVGGACAAAILAHGGLALWLLLAHRGMAQRMFPASGDAGPMGAVSDLEEVAFAVVGLVVLVLTIPQATGVLRDALAADESVLTWARGAWAQVCALALQLALGAALFLWPRLAVGLRGRLRALVRREPPPGPPVQTTLADLRR